MWTLIIARVSDLRPIAVIDSSDIARDEVGYEQSLPPGRYLVGNPETALYYGDLRRGQCLEITSSRGIPEGYRFYLTIYNRSSFPVS
jgi:hypothetical protein